MRRLLQYVLLSACSAALLAMVFEPFFAELLKQIGFDSTVWAAPVISLFSSLPVQLVSSAVFGAAFGAWLHSLAVKSDSIRLGSKNETSQLDFLPRAVLRVKHHGSRATPDELYQENLRSWFSLYSKEVTLKAVMEPGHAPAEGVHFPSDWTFFLKFEKPVKYRQLQVEFSDGISLDVTCYQQDIDSVIVFIAGPVPKCEIEFRTVGTY